MQYYFNNFVLVFMVFSAAMVQLVKLAEKISRVPVMSSGVIQPPAKVFMNDMTITARSVLEGKWT